MIKFSSNSRRAAFLLATFFVAVLAQPSLISHTAKIAKAFIDSENKLHIVDAAGHETQPTPEKDQTSASSINISEDRRTVAWLAEFPNCCTSYPVALKLIVYRDGQIKHRLGNGMLILSNWHFLDGGKRVAFATNTVHGDFSPHYELHDVYSGRLLQKWEGHPTANSPKWARDLAD